jgi:hypothetical protein
MNEMTSFSFSRVQFSSSHVFSEEARDKGAGVLVHCLAGVSRSVTFTLAYLMYKLHLNFNDAFDFVRRRKGNIAPNFTFLEQLLEFERDQLPDLRKIYGAAVDEKMKKESKSIVSEGESSTATAAVIAKEKTEEISSASSIAEVAPFSAASPDSGIDFG